MFYMITQTTVFNIHALTCTLSLSLFLFGMSFIFIISLPVSCIRSLSSVLSVSLSICLSLSYSFSCTHRHTQTHSQNEHHLLLQVLQCAEQGWLCLAVVVLMKHLGSSYRQHILIMDLVETQGSLDVALPSLLTVFI